MRRYNGFTLIEILIAISILTVGIVGVIALFPVAIQVGGEAITNSLSADMARSVEENIRASLKHRRFVYAKSSDRDHVLTAFFYNHDGIFDPRAYKDNNVRKDPMIADTTILNGRDTNPLLPGGTPWALDNVILLPADNTRRASMGYSGDNARQIAYRSGKVFVYPEGDPNEGKITQSQANGAGDPRNADDDKDDFQQDYSNQNVVEKKRSFLLPNEDWPLRVTRTYRFGARLGALLPERPQGATLYKISRHEDDPYQNYSYAIAIRRAYEDANLSPFGEKYIPANELYEVKLMIFRGFKPETKTAYPIYTTTFLLSR